MSRSLLMTGKRRSPYYPVGSDCVLYHAYWDGTAADHSGKHHDGTVYGGVFVENGIALDGIDDYVTVPYHADFAFTKDFTVLFYANIDSTGDKLGSLVAQFRNWAGHRKWIFHYGLDGNTNKFVWRGEGASIYANCPTAAAKNPDVWHMIGGTHTNGTFEIYAAGLTENTSQANTDLVADVWPIDIGATRDDGGALTAWGWIKSKIGEVLIFNSVLSPANILNYYNATKGRYGL